MVAAHLPGCSSRKPKYCHHAILPLTAAPATTTVSAMHLKGFAKHTAVFGSLTTLSRLTGLLRMVALAAILGSGRGAAGRLNDAYQLANTIPNILYEFIMGGVLSALFIPVLVRAQEKSGKTSAESWRVANLLLGGAGLILAGVSALGVLFAPR